ncbi:MAG: Gfo/Idh/MocA family protein, partial [Iamia sp.]
AERRRRDRHGVAHWPVDELLAADGGGVVVVAAPARDHAELALAALDHGKHVYVEKPLALTLADAERVVARAEETGRVLMVGHLLQYHPAFLALRQLVADGDLGALRYLSSNRLNLGRVRREENSLWSFAPHDISMILALVGDEPSEVWAQDATFLSPGVADVTTTHLSFPGGQQAHVHVSWLHPFKEQRLVVVGEKAMAVFDDTLGWDEKLRTYRHSVDLSGPVPTADRAEAHPVSLAPDEPLRLECQHFLDSIHSGDAPRTDGAEGVRVLRVLARAEECLRTSASEVVPASAGHPGVHPSAVIDDDVTIGAGTRIWHFSHVLAGSRVGQGCTIGQNVVIGPEVEVGDRCRVQNNVSLYQGVTLEDGVFCGPSAVFTNVHNPRAEVSRQDEFRTTVVRRGATIGANATIVCGHEIGAYAFVGAGAVVTGDVAPHALVVGNPARPVGWMSHDGERLGPDLVCPRTGRAYEVQGGALRDRDEP